MSQQWSQAYPISTWGGMTGYQVQLATDELSIAGLLNNSTVQSADIGLLQANGLMLWTNAATQQTAISTVASNLTTLASNMPPTLAYQPTVLIESAKISFFFDPAMASPHAVPMDSYYFTNAKALGVKTAAGTTGFNLTS